MRARMFGVFVIGMAFGMVILVAALWYSGTLRSSAVLAGPAPPVIVPPPPPAVVEPEHTAAPAPPPAPEPEHPAELSGVAPPHLSMPIAGIDPSKIADTFSDSRDGRTHDALDIPAPRGTPVMAVAEGNVVKLFNSKPGGITVYQFDNTGTWCYYYAHLDRYARGLKEGTLLRKGDVLGYVGSTGNASAAAPHLHFAVNRLGPGKKWWEGTPVDPLPLLR